MKRKRSDSAAATMKRTKCREKKLEILNLLCNPDWEIDKVIEYCRGNRELTDLIKMITILNLLPMTIKSDKKEDILSSNFSAIKDSIENDYSEYYYSLGGDRTEGAVIYALSNISKIKNASQILNCIYSPKPKEIDFSIDLKSKCIEIMDKIYTLFPFLEVEDEDYHSRRILLFKHMAYVKHYINEFKSELNLVEQMNALVIKLMLLVHSKNRLSRRKKKTFDEMDVKLNRCLSIIEKIYGYEKIYIMEDSYLWEEDKKKRLDNIIYHVFECKSYIHCIKEEGKKIKLMNNFWSCIGSNEELNYLYGKILDEFQGGLGFSILPAIESFLTMITKEKFLENLIQ